MADILTEAEVRELEDRCADMPPGPWRMPALIRTLRAEQAKLAKIRDDNTHLIDLRNQNVMAVKFFEEKAEAARRETWAEAARFVRALQRGSHGRVYDQIAADFERRAQGEGPTDGR